MRSLVLGNTRNFNAVFAAAQQKLRDTFGMELTELPSRAGLEKDGDEGPNEAEVATGAKKRGEELSPSGDLSVLTNYPKLATALGSKTYIVRSVLDPILIEHAAQTEEEILEEESADQALLFPSQSHSDDEGDASDDDGERPAKYYGSLISWSKADQLGSLGILYVILSLVLASGRVMSDGE